ncbi:hypothetical protein E3N88_00499 [Mikania micrantha]|uniref:Uncharacterized protein n=1 Tax=Mikania micrantha TaxID=192012 RepID=A0A5N6PZ18_9ASTR|nr:hypothetical protein E3N88_00499 [Mikania micrantha]
MGKWLVNRLEGWRLEGDLGRLNQILVGVTVTRVWISFSAQRSHRVVSLAMDTRSSTDVKKILEAMENDKEMAQKMEEMQSQIR